MDHDTREREREREREVSASMLVDNNGHVFVGSIITIDGMVDIRRVWRQGVRSGQVRSCHVMSCLRYP